ncbi:hypothetical protein Peur_029755 [Populus x canadensis]
MKNQKIAIPRRFLRKHGESLSKSAVIKVPSAATWKVELLKHKDEVSFAKGWEMFIAYYSIDYGDFLVFEYEGNSLFTVFIIDKSFTEVGYQWNNTDAAESNQEDKLEDHEDDDDDDAFVEFIDISSGSQETGKGTKGKEKLGCSRNSEEYEGDHGGRPAENKCHPSGTPLEKKTNKQT